MKNLKMRWKLLIAFGLVILLIIAMNGFSLVNLRKSSNLLIEMYDGPHINTLSAVALGRELRQMNSSLQTMVLSGDTASNAQDYKTSRSAVDADITALSGQYQAKLANFSYQLSSMDSAYTQICSLVDAGKLKEAGDLLLSTYAPVNQEAVKAANSLAVEINSSAEAFRTESKTQTDFNVIIQDVFFVIIVLAAFCTAIKLAKDITIPLEGAAEGMAKFSAGNFDVQLQSDSTDELGILTCQLNESAQNMKNYIQDISYTLGEMSQNNISLSVDREYVGAFVEIKNSLNRIIGSMNHTMSEIRRCCGLVRSGAANLADSAVILSQGARDQSQAVEEFRTCLERVAELTVEDSKNAEHISRISIESQDSMNTSNQQMGDMLKAIQEIQDSSQEIAKVNTLIDNIAFQTNILALNAAVEAARAGAAGKGFGIVADEVRNLASKSADAAEKTNEIINRTLQSVATGTELAEAVAESLKTAGDNVGQMGQVLVSINESTAEQGEAFTSMQAALEKISGVVDANASAAQDNSSASVELSSQAEALETLVERFRLKDTL